MRRRESFIITKEMQINHLKTTYMQNGVYLDQRTLNELEKVLKSQIALGLKQLHSAGLWMVIEYQVLLFRHLTPECKEKLIHLEELVSQTDQILASFYPRAEEQIKQQGIGQYFCYTHYVPRIYGSYRFVLEDVDGLEHVAAVRDIRAYREAKGITG